MKPTGRLTIGYGNIVHSGLLLVQRATEIVTRRGDGSVNTVAAAARATDGRIVTGMNVYHFTGEALCRTGPSWQRCL